MVSRDTRLQVVAVIAFVALLSLWMLATGGAASATHLDPLDALFAVCALFFVVAGAHLYLALRGDGGMVPVGARWRFAFVVLVSLLLAFTGANLSDAEPVAGIEPQIPVFGGLVVLLAFYFLYEARQGYRERRPS